MAISGAVTGFQGTRRQQRHRGYLLKAAVILVGLRCLLTTASRAFLAPSLPGTFQVRRTQDTANGREAFMVDGRIPFAGEER
eukprot:CAMPEP_0172873788 /NCGR_PEP_ID=MMETSP1075-20121228/96354_1 /TAXON_ID=2916 /ORGANISM="Ceratium fusus, Strain PA161109" /LENGTH=81 /DNA_ID=CAMNT_0013724433 /DNA_START=6 /DNA_END=247 /DNA_ORIENTATION=+